MLKIFSFLTHCK